MTNRNLLRRFKEYDETKPQIVTEISGLLGIPIGGAQQVEVPNRNGFVYVRLRNNTNELIQAFNEKVSPVYGLPVLVKWVVNRYEVQGRDTSRYQDWGSFSAFLPRHGSQHSLNFEDGQGGDVSFIYSRQFMPFSAIPSGTDGAGTVFVMPHTYRNPVDFSWNYIGDLSSPEFLPAKPTGTSARMMLLYWDLDASTPLIATGTFLAENLTGTSSVLSAIPVVTNSRHIPLAGIRLVSGTQSLLWDNIYDIRQFATTTPGVFGGGFAVQDEGIPVGTGTTLNFVGGNVVASISGSVVQIYVTGSAGGVTFSGVDQIGIFGQDEGVPVGTGTILNFVGTNVDVSRSGTVLRVFVTGSSAGTVFSGVDQIGIYALDEGVLLGTGTRINFVGAGVTTTISGTMLNVDIPAGSPGPQGPPGAFGVATWDEGIPIGSGTVMNFVGAGVTATLSGTVVNVAVSSSYITTILDQTVPTAGQADFDVRVSGTYSRIEIMLNGKIEGAVTNDVVFLYFNGDTLDTNYRYGQHRAAATHAYSAGDDPRIAILPGTTATRSNAPGSALITILDPFNSSYEKTARSFGGIRFATDSELWDYYLQWESTAPINRIFLRNSLNSDFASGTHCKIYGYE